jgi:HK97 family phage major capsid protein
MPPTVNGEELTLTHSQTVARQKDIFEDIERLKNKPAEDYTPDDERKFEDYTTEFERLDVHRKKLEREAAHSRLKVVREALNYGARTEDGTPLQQVDEPPAAGMRGAAQTSDSYDRDVFAYPNSIQDGQRNWRDPYDLSAVKFFGRSRESVVGELRTRAIDAIERMQGATDEIREAGTHIVERWDDDEGTIAKMVLTTSKPAYMRAFAKASRNAAHMMTTDEKAAVEECRAMSLTPSAGGYLVPFQLDPTVIITANGSNNEVRRVARNVVATGNKWNGISSGLVSWSWDAEAAEVSDDATTFAQPAIDVFMARGFVPISIEALEDEVNVTANVAELLAGGREVLEAAAFINGTGTGQPWGVVARLTGSGAEVNSATADTFAIGDVYSMHGSLPTRYRRNAAWMGNTLIYNRVRQFDTAGGAGLWTTIGNGQPDSLLGRPTIEAEDMTGTITGSQNNRILVFGDFSNYVIADRIGMTVEFVPHLFGTTNGRPKGQRGWFAYYRTGADVVNTAAFKMLNA